MSYGKTMKVWAALMAFTILVSCIPKSAHAVQAKPLIDFPDRSEPSVRELQLLVPEVEPQPKARPAIYFQPAPGAAVIQQDGPGTKQTQAELDDEMNHAGWLFAGVLAFSGIAAIVLIALPWRFPRERQKDVPPMPTPNRCAMPRPRDEAFWRNLLK